MASPPTLSRFENAARRQGLVRMSEALAERVIARHKRRKKRVKRITIHLDLTVGPAHFNPKLQDNPRIVVTKTRPSALEYRDSAKSPLFPPRLNLYNRIS